MKSKFELLISIFEYMLCTLGVISGLPATAAVGGILGTSLLALVFYENREVS